MIFVIVVRWGVGYKFEYIGKMREKKVDIVYIDNLVRIFVIKSREMK